MDARETWRQVRALDTPGKLTLGSNTFDRWVNDPKRLSFMLGRYAFAAKMLRDCGTILELGAGDGFGAVTFLRDTRATRIVGLDFDADLVAYANENIRGAVRSATPDDAGRLVFKTGNALDGICWVEGRPFEGVVSLDVIEHLEPSETDTFIANAAGSLGPHGIFVVGTPSANASHLGSAHSQAGHTNLLTPDALRAALKAHFPTVLMFGFQDATLHIGHEALWHYVLGVAVHG